MTELCGEGCHAPRPSSSSPTESEFRDSGSVVVNLPSLTASPFVENGTTVPEQASASSSVLGIPHCQSSAPWSGPLPWALTPASLGHAPTWWGSALKSIGRLPRSWLGAQRCLEHRSQAEPAPGSFDHDCRRQGSWEMQFQPQGPTQK